MSKPRYSALNRWGFSVPVTATTTGQVQFTDLIAVNVDDPQSWVLQLNALRYQNGTLPIGATQPTDNQVQSLAGSNPPAWKAIISLGVGDGSERVTVDYYARGCTMPLHAAIIRIALSGTINASNSGLPPPILSGMVSPGHRVLTGAPNPTFTTAFFTINASASVLVPIPARAIAYRIFNPGTAVSAQSAQTDAGGVVIQFDRNGVPPASQEQGNATGSYPLNPSAQFVQITNLDAGTQSYALQFLLDMG
jgi:hypothetical protein